MSDAFVPIRGLHHYAYRCRDCEETRAFYEDVLGLPLVHVIRSDIVPSTGERASSACIACHSVPCADERLEAL